MIKESMSRWIRNMKYRIDMFLTRFIGGFKYLWFIWHNDVWDYVSLLNIMKKRMLEMAEYHRKYGMCVNSKHYHKILKIAASDIDKIADMDVHYSDVWLLYREKFGETEMIEKERKENGCVLVEFIRTKCKSEKEQEYASKVFSRLMKRQDYLYQKHKKRLIKILNKHIDRWGD